MNFLGIVTVRQVLLEVNQNNREARFQCKISVLSLLELAATLVMEQSVLSFEVTTPALTVSGTAAMAERFLESKFDLRVEVHLGEVAAALEDAVNEGLQQVAKLATEVWEAAEAVLRKAWETAKELARTTWNGFWANVQWFFEDLDNALDTLIQDPFIDNLMTAAQRLEEGDLLGALKAFATALGAYGEEGHVLVDAHLPEHPDAFNEYKCRMKKWRWDQCLYGANEPNGKRCDGPYYSDPFPDQECMTAVMRTATEIHIMLSRMRTMRDSLKASKEANAAYTQIIDGVRVPAPTLQPLSVDIPYGSTTAVPVRVRGTVKQVDGAGQLSTEVDVEVQAELDFSNQNALDARMADLKALMAAEMATAVVAGQELPENLMAGSGKWVWKAPVLGAGSPVEVSCNVALDLAAHKPQFLYIDPACACDSRVAIVGIAELPSSDFPDRVCGTTFLDVSWRGYDSPACNGQSNAVLQRLVVLPASPEFSYVPPDTTVHVHGPVDGATLATIGTDVTGVPRGRAPCNQEYRIDMEDTSPEDVGCGRYRVERSWSIRPSFPQNVCAGPTAPATIATQVITLQTVTEQCCGSAAPRGAGERCGVEAVANLLDAWSTAGAGDAPLADVPCATTSGEWRSNARLEYQFPAPGDVVLRLSTCTAPVTEETSEGGVSASLTSGAPSGQPSTAFAIDVGSSPTLRFEVRGGERLELAVSGAAAILLHSMVVYSAVCPPLPCDGISLRTLLTPFVGLGMPYTWAMGLVSEVSGAGDVEVWMMPLGGSVETHGSTRAGQWDLTCQGAPTTTSLWMRPYEADISAQPQTLYFAVPAGYWQHLRGLSLSSARHSGRGVDTGAPVEVVREGCHCYASFAVDAWPQPPLAAPVCPCTTDGDACSFFTAHEAVLRSLLLSCIQDACPTDGDCVVFTGHGRGGAVAQVAALVLGPSWDRARYTSSRSARRRHSGPTARSPPTAGSATLPSTSMIC